MKIVFLPNWSVVRSTTGSLPHPNSQSNEELYWFFRHWPDRHLEVSVVDVSAPRLISFLERKLLHAYVWQLLRAIRLIRSADLIIAHGAQSVVALCAFKALCVLPLPPIVLFDVGCVNGGDHSRHSFRLIRRLLRGVDLVIYHASIQREFYRKYLPDWSERASFVRFGMDIEVPTITEEGAPFVLALGYDNRSRDWALLLTALHALGDETSLRVVGYEGPPFPRSLPAGITTECAVSWQRVTQLIDQALFCVLPLPELPFAFAQQTLLHCMARGKAVVITDSSGVRDYIQHGKDCLVAPVGDAVTFSEHIASLLKNAELRERIGQGARRKAMTLTEAAMALDVRQAIMECLERR